MARAVIPGLLLGTPYYVRIRSKNDVEISEWSRLFAFETVNDTMPPKPISNLQWLAVGDSFIATWDDPTENEDGSPLYDLKDVAVIISSVDNSQSHTFFVPRGVQRFEFTFEMNQQVFGRITVQCELRFTGIARDLNLNNSVPVSQIVKRPPPPPVKNLKTTTHLLTISLDWDAPDTTDISGYSVHQSLQEGFTPDETTFIRVVPDSSYDFRTADTATHWFKVATVGKCGQLSDFVEISGVAEGIFNVDIEAPPQMTNIVATNVDSKDDKTGANRLVNVTWDAITVDDLAGYEIRYTADKLSMANARVIRAAGDAKSVTIAGLSAGVDYYIQARAVDFSSNYGLWNSANPYPLRTTADLKPPHRPALPTVAGSMAKIMVTHDLKDVDGAPLDLDLNHLNVYVGRTKDFLLDDSTKVGSIVTQPATMGIPAIQTFAYPVEEDQKDRYVVVVAVDTSGNESAPSDAAKVTIDLIENTYIENATIQAAKIGSLYADSIIAGKGIINNLQVYAGLTIGASAGVISETPIEGYIQSQSWIDSAGSSGYHIDTQGVTIRSGSISARALEINLGGNLMQAQYASFEGHSAVYTSSSMFIVNNGGAGLAALGKALGLGKYNQNSLSIIKSGPVGAGINANVFFGKDLNDRQLTIEADQRYVASVWMKTPTLPNNQTNLAILAIYTPEMGYQAALDWKVVETDSNGWVRLSGYFDSTVFSNAILFIAVNDNYPLYIDGVQFEKKTGTTDLPSPWAPPGLTSINGGVITTGEIRSTSVAWNHPNEPAWSINVDGDMHVGNAVIRGALVVGDIADPLQSILMSANYNPSRAGWIIDSFGNAEFNSVYVRGIVDATGGNFTGNVRVGNAPTNFIASQSWVPGGIGWMLQGDGYAEITNARLQNLSVFGNVTLGGPFDGVNGIYQHYIKSANYAANAGWVIYSNGYAQFNNVDVRGNITGSVISGSRFIGNAFATALPGTERMGFDAFELINNGPLPQNWDSTQPMLIWASLDNKLNSYITYSTPLLETTYYSKTRHHMWTDNPNGVITLGTPSGGNIALTGGVITFPDLAVVGGATAIGVLGSPVGQVVKMSSSKRYKTNIEDVYFHDGILDLIRPVTFQGKYDLEKGNDKQHLGIIAEEIWDTNEPVLQSLVQLNEDGLPESFQYDRVVVILVDITKRLINRVNKLENRIKELDK